MKTQIILDIECYENYFLAMFYNPKTEQFVWFERTADKPLNIDAIHTILDNAEIVTFNGINYDLPVLSEALRGRDCKDIRRVSDMIIMQEQKPWQIEKMFGKVIPCDHVDLIEVAFGKASLKIYGGRLGCRKLQDLPIAPDSLLSREEMTILREYCKNDVITTAELLKTLTPQIDLRRTMSEEYGVDLRSKSDAQIAEAVIAREITRLTGTSPRKPSSKPKEFTYTPPAFLTGIPEEVTSALHTPFKVKANGVVEMPEVLSKLKVTIGGTSYQLGMGGIHSTEKSRYYLQDDETLLADFDVTSYYPSIILRCGLYPPQMGEQFLTIYRAIVDERVTAKQSGDKVKADALKIVVNGSFGKFGSPYSVLYAPNLLIQTTVTGQLSLLMLIGWMESQGISVISANTDGIVCRCPRGKESLMLRIIALWEKQTGFGMERTDYLGLYSRDVNNYVAVKPDGKVKTKGCYGFAGMSKNPQNEVCNIAVIEYLKNKTDIKTTIENEKDIKKFLTIRTVKGGAVKDGEVLGKAVRWYYNGNDGTINYKTNGNKVPKSDGAQPLMDLPDDFPTDVDYEWYINEANELLQDLGVK